ncbi:hypothetical protein M378DRAFT_160615, partial [Amanita muscaria Koide BX008]
MTINAHSNSFFALLRTTACHRIYTAIYATPELRVFRLLPSSCRCYTIPDFIARPHRDLLDAKFAQCITLSLFYAVLGSFSL